MIAEIQESLNANYSDINSCFEFFMTFEREFHQLKREVTQAGFNASIQSLIPKRFDKNDLNYIWRKIAGSSESISFQKFKSIFDNRKFTGAKYVDAAK